MCFFCNFQFAPLNVSSNLLPLINLWCIIYSKLISILKSKIISKPLLLFPFKSTKICLANVTTVFIYFLECFVMNWSGYNGCFLSSMREISLKIYLNINSFPIKILYLQSNDLQCNLKNLKKTVWRKSRYTLVVHECNEKEASNLLSMVMTFSPSVLQIAVQID